MFSSLVTPAFEGDVLHNSALLKAEFDSCSLRKKALRMQTSIFSIS